MTTPDSLYDELLSRTYRMFKEENTIQIVLHAHLILEKALNRKIEEKLVRPDILKRDWANWTFTHKAALFVGMYDPPKEVERLLAGFNKLRNAVAHDFDDDIGKRIFDSLQWEGTQPTADPLQHLQICFIHVGLATDALKRLREEQGQT